MYRYYLKLKIDNVNSERNFPNICMKIRTSKVKRNTRNQSKMNFLGSQVMTVNIAKADDNLKNRLKFID